MVFFAASALDGLTAPEPGSPQADPIPGPMNAVSSGQKFGPDLKSNHFLGGLDQVHSAEPH